MIKLRLAHLLIIFFLSSTFAGENPVGPLWYTEKEEEPIEEQQGVPFNQLSFTDRAKVLNFYTMEALHKAQFTHRLEDMKNFLALQDYWLRESSIFRKLFEQTMLNYPQYDYSVTHPTSDLGIKITDEARAKKQKLQIEKIAKTHGILFFYRANNPFDQRQIPIIRDFCERYALSIMPIIVDGNPNYEFDNIRLDHGEAQALGLHFFPAMLLVNPHTKDVKPLAYGFTTQDVLEERVFAAISNLEDEV